MQEATREQTEEECQSPMKDKKSKQYWYPLKLIIPPNRSRQIMIEDRHTRKQVLKTILRHQGFDTQLQQYDLVGSFGDNSSNPVWLGTHKVTGLQVAIKKIDHSKYRQLKKQNHISEANAMIECQDSKHVISLIEAFRQSSYTYIVTKLAEGGDLMNYLGIHKVENLPETWTKRIVKQIASGLEHIHNNGIVHRDMKHMNIFFSNDTTNPRVKIADFGLASKLSDQH